MGRPLLRCSLLALGLAVVAPGAPGGQTTPPLEAASATAFSYRALPWGAQETLRPGERVVHVRRNPPAAWGGPASPQPLTLVTVLRKGDIPGTTSVWEAPVPGRSPTPAPRLLARVPGDVLRVDAYGKEMACVTSRKGEPNKLWVADEGGGGHIVAEGSVLSLRWVAPTNFYFRPTLLFFAPEAGGSGGAGTDETVRWRLYRSLRDSPPHGKWLASPLVVETPPGFVPDPAEGSLPNGAVSPHAAQAAVWRAEEGRLELWGLALPKDDAERERPEGTPAPTIAAVCPELAGYTATKMAWSPDSRWIYLTLQKAGAPTRHYIVEAVEAASAGAGNVFNLKGITSQSNWEDQGDRGEDANEIRVIGWAVMEGRSRLLLQDEARGMPAPAGPRRWRFFAPDDGSITATTGLPSLPFAEARVTADGTTVLVTDSAGKTELFALLKPDTRDRSDTPGIPRPAVPTPRPRPAASGSWPVYRGNPGHTSYSPERLRPPLRLLWRRPLGQKRRSLPEATPNWRDSASYVLAEGGRVYVATRQTRPSKPGAGRRLYALDARTGRPLWQRDGVTSTGCLSDGLLVTLLRRDASVEVAGLDVRTGALRWRQTARGGYSINPEFAPLTEFLNADQGRVISPFGVFTARTGTFAGLWPSEWPGGGPALDGHFATGLRTGEGEQVGMGYYVRHEMLLLDRGSLTEQGAGRGDNYGHMLAGGYAFSTGEVYNAPGSLSATPLTRFPAETPSAVGYEASLHPFEPAPASRTPTGAWSASADVALGPLAVFPGPRPTDALRVVLYVRYEDHDLPGWAEKPRQPEDLRRAAVVRAHDLKTGRVVWYHSPLTVVAPGAAVSDTVYLPAGFDFGKPQERGGLYALAADTGRMVWRYGRPGLSFGPPAIADKSLFVFGSDGYLYAFAETNKGKG